MNILFPLINEDLLSYYQIVKIIRCGPEQQPYFDYGMLIKLPVCSFSLIKRGHNLQAYKTYSHLKNCRDFLNSPYKLYSTVLSYTL